MPRAAVDSAPVESTPLTIIPTGWAWWSADNPSNTQVDDGGTTRVSVLDNWYEGAYTPTQGTMGNRPAYSATGLLSKPTLSFDRSRTDNYAFTALPSETYTMWAVLSLTAHTSAQRLLESTGVLHHIRFSSGENPMVNAATGVTHSTAIVATPFLLRVSYRSDNDLVRIALNNAASESGTATSGVAPAFTNLGGAAATPITALISEVVIVPGEYLDASDEVTAMNAWALAKYPGLWA